MDFKKSFIYIGVIFTLILSAQEKKNIRLGVIAKYENLKTLQANFIQTNYWPSYNKSNESEGTIYANSKKILLEYSNPKKQYLLINSDSLTIYIPETNQVLISQNSQNYTDFKIINIINGSTKDVTLGLMGTGRGAWDGTGRGACPVTLGVVHLALGLISARINIKQRFNLG